MESLTFENTINKIKSLKGERCYLQIGRKSRQSRGIYLAGVEGGYFYFEVEQP